MIIRNKSKLRVRSKKIKDGKLWDTFSLFIRLRDSDENGVCICFTCGRRTIWNKNTDSGHGIPRQHFSTKYNERNNHSQCKKCNGFEGGMREEYKKQMDNKYGDGTWDLMLTLSRKPSKISQFDIDVMQKHYAQLVKELRIIKGL